MPRSRGRPSAVPSRGRRLRARVRALVSSASPPITPLAALTLAVVVVLAGCTTPFDPADSVPTGTQLKSSDPTASEMASPDRPVTCEVASASVPGDVATDRNALEHRVDALRGFGTIADLMERHRAGERGTPALWLLETFNHTVAPNRIDNGSVFETDLAVVEGLGPGNESIASNLTRADAILAVTAVRRAGTTYQTLDDRGVSFDRTAVCDRLGEAHQRLTDGEALRRDGHAAEAISRYREAWTAAQAALVTMDGALAPQIELVTREDPVRSGPSRYLVQGTVYDVRLGDLSNVTVVVNGEPRTVPIYVDRYSDREPAVAVFGVRLTLHRPVNDIRIRVTDESDGATGRVSLQLDGDGLADVHERTLTTTDPLDPDSDAAATAANEAGNGVLDGDEDLDGDRWPSAAELEAGTDPLTADTDGDGLGDLFEWFYLESDPLVADGDGDGTLDGAEDADGDGLTNAAEAELGSDPTRADGDADGLDDTAEAEAGTDPLHPDTDEDGLRDVDEVRGPFETDPLVADSDGDGVLDGDERGTVTVADESLDVRLDIVGPRTLAYHVTVEDDSTFVVEESAFSCARVTPIVMVEGERPVDAATIAMGYDESDVPDGNESALALVRWNASAQFFEETDDLVLADEDTVRVTLDGFRPDPYRGHLDRFVVIHVPTFLEAWDTGECPTSRG